MSKSTRLRDGVVKTPGGIEVTLRAELAVVWEVLGVAVACPATNSDGQRLSDSDRTHQTLQMMSDPDGR